MKCEIQTQDFLNHEMWDSNSGLFGPWNLRFELRSLGSKPGSLLRKNNCFLLVHKIHTRWKINQLIFLKLSSQYRKIKSDLLGTETITYFLITIIFLIMQSLVTLWPKALGRQNSTQDWEVQGSNPDQNMFPKKKYFDQRGPTRGLGNWREKI